MRLGREGQAARSGEIEHARIAPAFDHHGPQRRAAQRIHRRTQHRHLVGQAGEQHPIGRETQIGKPRAIGAAATPNPAICAQPQQRRAPSSSLASSREEGKQEGETSGAARIPGLRAEQFMDLSPRQPAAKRRIHAFMPRRETGARFPGGTSTQGCDLAPERGKS